MNDQKEKSLEKRLFLVNSGSVMENIKLNERLMTAVSFARRGCCFADVGTDHAYLPIYLVQCAIAERSVASDINEGPLARAEENIEKYGLSSVIKTSLCDGLSGIEKYSPDDIAVFGMGGELIVKIIDEAEWLKDRSKKIRLILQPMTHPEKVREYLAENGFNIVGEELSLDRGKIYQTVCAEYDGVKRNFDDVTLMLGEHNINKKDDLLFDLAKRVRGQAEKRLRGKESGGDDARAEQELIRAITYILEDL